MIANSWKFVTPAPDIEDRIDARAILKTLPKRMIEAVIKRAEGKRQKLDADIWAYWNYIGCYSVTKWHPYSKLCLTRSEE